MNSKASPTPTLSLSFRFNTKQTSYYPESIIFSLCILIVLSLHLKRHKPSRIKQNQIRIILSFSTKASETLEIEFARGERTVIKECIHSLHENVLSFHLQENYPTSFFYTFSPFIQSAFYCSLSFPNELA